MGSSSDQHAAGEASAAAFEAHASPFRPEGPMERAVLVAVEFTGDSRRRRNLSTAALQARASARAGRFAADEDSGADAVPDADSSGAEDFPPVGPDRAGRAQALGSQALDYQALGSQVLDFEASLAEFRELTESAGASVAATVIQRRPRPDAATLVGPGKVEEIEAVVASTAADLVLFDHDLSPTQLRNLEDRLPCRVIDRTQLILDIFARHARTREGQLQVELAQLEYQLPRLTGRGKAMSQLGGGIGTRGPGETKLETDRRRLDDRVAHLKEQLEGVRRIRRQQRQRREAVPVPVVALVGYTNAGKSTLFNALTAAGVLESAKMFATLDPKLKTITLPSRRRVLLSDTVGFIRNLPHTLITSFRATLEEVERAEILVHVRDLSNPTADEQKVEVEKVLGELEVQSKPVLEVWNKIDLLDPEQRAKLGIEPGATPAGSAAHPIALSGRTGEGVEALLHAIDASLVQDPLVSGMFRLPQSEGAALAAFEGGAVLGAKRFEGNVVFFEATGPASLLDRFRRFRVRVERAEVPGSSVR